MGQCKDIFVCVQANVASTATASVLNGTFGAIDDSLMSEIMLRVRVVVGGGNRYSTIRNRRGHILKAVPPGQERILFQFVYDTYGITYSKYVALK